MEAREQKTRIAWQPLTPGGVASFAEATLGRLLLVQLVAALIAAGVVVWFLQHNWFPEITQGIRNLPAQGQIQYRTLDWRGGSPHTLSENHFLAFTVDLTHEGRARSPADVQVEFGRHDVWIVSLFGFMRAEYPRGWTIAFNQPDLQPRWGAWAPVFLALAAAGVVLVLMVSWALLASLYCGAAWLAGFFANRRLSLAGSWRLCGAALMPGALWMLAAMVLYGLGILDLIRLMVAAGLHLAVGWTFLFLSLPHLPRHPEAGPPQSNPFTGSAASPAQSSDSQSSVPPSPRGPAAEP